MNSSKITNWFCSPQKLLSAAAAVATFQAAVHTIMFSKAEPRSNSIEAQIVKAMNQDFRENGSTYWEMYYGYGLLSAAYAGASACLLIILSRYKPAEERLAKRIAAIVAGTTMIHAILAFRYFFALPAVFDLVVLALVLAALARMANTGDVGTRE